jgi:hypothetical protein
MFVMSLKVLIMLNSSGSHSHIQKNQQKIATEQIKTPTRSKLIKQRSKDRKSKCLNHLTALTISNLKCHIIYFSRRFHNNQ